MSTRMVWSVPPPKWISWWMLYYKRNYVIEKIKAPLRKAIAILAMRYPEPTKEHTRIPNTHRLLDIEHNFFECQVGNGTLLRAIWRMFIIEYEHDPYYRERINEILWEIKESDWDYSERPQSYWRKKDGSH